MSNLDIVQYQPGQTVVNLDVTRREMSELPLAFARRSSDIDTAQGGRNLVTQWPSTSSWTLQPINLATDFAETANYEFMKLRLSDFSCNTDYFTEVAEGHRGDQNGGNPYDYFIAGRVNQSNLPNGYPYTATGTGSFLFAGLTPVVDTTVTLATQNLQQDNTVIALSSNATFAYNQGFFLRFWIEGRPSHKRSALMDFFFGEYALRINSNGVAELQQTADFQTYSLIYTFQWTAADRVHAQHHNLLIFPHARNKIEFLSQDQDAAASLVPFGVPGARGPVHGGLYEIPGELVYQPDGVTPIITGSAPIYLAFSREFRPHVQVSQLGFVNGNQPQGGGQAYLFDGAIDLHAFPGIPINAMIDADANGGTLAWQLLDPTTLIPWQPDTPTCNLCQMCVAMAGLGDGGGGIASSQTPEFYGYALDKGFGYYTVNRQTVTTSATSVRIDKSDKAETERLTLTIDNSLGQVQQFEERGNIPLTVVDNLTGLTLFEGTATGVEAGEAVKPAQVLTLECAGMIDKLRRKHFTDLAPNFGKDPYDNQGRGYYWSSAVYWAFAMGGFDPSQVVIENVATYDFRLWDDGGGGGTRGGAGSATGDGHVTNSGMEGPRWKPKFDTTPDDFLQSLLCDWLGWDYAWNTLDHRWHCWKRPLPTNPIEWNYNPVCSFWDSVADAAQYDNSGLPIYIHSKARSQTTRPQYTTVIASAILNEAQILSRAELQAALVAAQGGNSNASDPLIKTLPRTVSCAYDNKAGYPGPTNQPPNIAHPDYLGEPCTRWFTIAAPSRDALEWWTRMVGYDLTHGYVYKEFVADWGDAITLSLRKWTRVFFNGRPAFIDHVEADWARDSNRRANYRVSIARADAPPPR